LTTIRALYIHQNLHTVGCTTSQTKSDKMLMSPTHYITIVKGVLMYQTHYNWNPYWVVLDCAGCDCVSISTSCCDPFWTCSTGCDPPGCNTINKLTKGIKIWTTRQQVHYKFIEKLTLDFLLYSLETHLCLGLLCSLVVCGMSPDCWPIVPVFSVVLGGDTVSEGPPCHII
jgi:hypothetical protein